MAETPKETEERLKVIRLEVEELKRLLANEVAQQKKALILQAIQKREAILAPYEEAKNKLLREAEEQRKAMLREAEEQRKAMLKIELAQTEEESEYLLHSEVEIVSILRALKDSNETVTLYFNNANDFILTSIFSVSDEENVIALYAGGNAAANRQAMVADKLYGVSSLEKVRIQFVLHGLKLAQYRGRQCFIADMPEAILRLQRRENFRLVVPIRQPVKCIIPIPPPEDQADQPEQPAVEIEVNVVDVSGGGIGIVMPPEDVAFAPDMVFEKCQIELPGVGTIVATLRVRSTFEVSVRDGPVSRRAGCQFVSLAGPMLALLQRYIIKEERERKAREAGLAKGKV
ncbi:MAG: flagellar brake protein [Betaproteobacteria bacterium]|nr:flagellar brake protein [Betaproteobacteria bacterium]